MIIKKHESGSAHVVIIIALVAVIIGLLGFIFWRNFINKTDSTSSEQSVTGSDTNRKVSIYPQDSSGKTATDSFTVTLPSGWSVQNVYEENDIVKTTSDGKQYLISSFVSDAKSTYMENNQVSAGDVIKTVKSGQGTSISVVKTASSLTLTTCKPTGNDCYLQLNGKPLYVHLYWNKPGAQSLVDIDYTSASAQEIIDDFESIAESLNI